MENLLRGYACLTEGDVIALHYNDKVYELRVVETKPARGISIIECDLNTDFAPPVGYVEPQRMPPPPPTISPVWFVCWLVCACVCVCVHACA